MTFEIDERTLIVNQQLEIEKLKNMLQAYENARIKISNIIYGIGGPLNDNKLEYSDEQLTDFYNIKEAFGIAWDDNFKNMEYCILKIY